MSKPDHNSWTAIASTTLKLKGFANLLWSVNTLAILIIKGYAY